MSAYHKITLCKRGRLRYSWLAKKILEFSWFFLVTTLPIAVQCLLVPFHELASSANGAKGRRGPWCIFGYPETAFSVPNTLESEEEIGNLPLSSSFSSGNSSAAMNFRQSTSGLSKFHQSILSRTSSVRQCFVTGRYPLSVSVRHCPTRKWLGWKSNSELLVNDTALSRSLASLDRYHWVDGQERKILSDAYNMVSLEFIAEIYVERPGYLHILSSADAGSSAAWMKQPKLGPRFLGNSQPSFVHNYYNSRSFNVDNCPVLPTDRLWVTGFSLAGRSGLVYSIEADSGLMKSVHARTRASMLWPNEVAPVPSQICGRRWSSSVKGGRQGGYQDALLVADGFLVPGKDRGGLYVVKHPTNPDAESTLRISSTRDRWFYHRASWADLTGDGRLSILSARCKVSTRLSSKADGTSDRIATGITKEGQLIWFECPKPHKIDDVTGTPLESDGTVFDPFAAKHLPWKEHILAKGPDVMFCLVDMDEEDDTIEVLCSEFFNKRVTLKSIRRNLKPKVVMERIIDDRCGAAFGCIPAFLDVKAAGKSGYPMVLDAGSTVPSLREGDCFSHVLVTSHECSYLEPDDSAYAETTAKNSEEVTTDQSAPDGGSLFAYRVPRGKDAWKTEPWIRSTVATGFKVKGRLGNMINPGSPGFVYTFHAKESERNSRRPLIAVAGDCAESAYLFRPNTELVRSKSEDLATSYKLMAEIKCEATVGSIAIGYDDFLSVEQESGYAKLYIPCFEKDKILVFALGSGEAGVDDW